MATIFDDPAARTSASIRKKTHVALKAAVTRLKSANIPLSKQWLMRQCLRHMLRFWRGRKDKAYRPRHYNTRPGNYEIVPLYMPQILHAVAWARCHHAGVSLSRLIDVAVTVFLPRVLEECLASPYRGRSREEVDFWKRKKAQRRHPSHFVINYAQTTQRNDGIVLSFSETTTVVPWTRAFPAD